MTLNSVPSDRSADKLEELLDALEEAIYDEAEIREVVRLAGLNAGEIEFRGKARNTWTDVVNSVTRSGRTAALSAELRGRMAENDKLTRALAEWEALAQADRQAALAGPMGCRPDFLTLNVLTEPPNNNPAALLNARYHVVPFFAAPVVDMLGELETWRDAPARTSVRLLVGPAGSGKTRLLLEWCQQVKADGWLAGFLPADVTDEQIACLAHADQPAIAVVDYAEARTELPRLLRAVAGRPNSGGSPLRIILLARQVGDWWRALGMDDDVHPLLEQYDPLRMVELPAEGELRETACTQAMAAFAARRGKQTPNRLPDLSDPLFGRMLYVHMAALAAVEELPLSANLLLDTVVRREKEFWRRAFRSDQSNLRKLQRDDLGCSRFVAALTLRGGAASVEAAETLNKLVGLPDKEDLVPFVRDLYPGKDGDYLEGLQPDLLGENLVAGVLHDPNNPSAYLDQVFSDGDAAGLRNGFLVLGRLALAGEKDAEGWLERVLEADVPGRARSALEAALALGEQSAYAPLGEKLAGALAQKGTLEQAREFEALLPEQTVSLREVSVWSLQCQLVALGKAAGAAAWVERARLANVLGQRLSDLGWREDALLATEEAVRFYRAVVQVGNDGFLPFLASSLSNLGLRLADLGRHEEALAPTEEAVATWRTLAEAPPDYTGPDGFLPDLASSLSNLGLRLADVGRPKDALAPTEDAVVLWRTLAEARPATFLPNLATSLNNLGHNLSVLGRHEDALRATEEALTIRRALAQRRPDAFLPDLATSLNNLGHDLSVLGRHEDALRATEEAVAIRRRLAEAQPDAFRPVFARSLSNLGIELGALGWREDALKATEEAVAILRELAEARPDAFLTDLAISLHNLGDQLRDSNRPDDALVAYHDAVAALSRRFLALPSAYARQMAKLVGDYATIARQLTQPYDNDLVAPINAKLRELLQRAAPGTKEPAP